ncbi:hypothetical protein M427DRAFT_63205 [Gonapodya prolifera JEL478]|uniref:Uncharacterized protein n=1 Tax=Gonapodya prolifera (strain JEL478) TaxID=1344416 RepID=A0A138ZZP1_GONPJ|nr:hypothetical protein M427DRAFT_63205 [Gonapodya prolifera JEL478]|eukprot:KXS09969.1 hypothetical protein M427DRAFT_63205 [Gonapodya prolifera JEL478]
MSQIVGHISPEFSSSSSCGVSDKTQLHLKPRSFLMSAAQSDGDSLPTGIAPEHM